MAITLRFTDEQEQTLARVLQLTGQSTKSKAIMFLIENAESLLESQQLMKDFYAARMLHVEAEIAQGQALGSIKKLIESKKLSY